METACLTASETTGLIWNLKNPISRHAERRRAEVTVHLLEPQQSDSILDVGCGDGYQLSYITRQLHTKVGIDTSLKKLKEAKRRVGGVNYVCASSENLPFKHKTFSRVMCLELLEHLPNPANTLSEIERVMRKFGILIVSVPNEEHITLIQSANGKLTPLYGHLHSFNERKLASLVSNNFSILHQDYICNTIASYPLFAFLPASLWKLLDNLTRNLPGNKPSWFISKIRKCNARPHD